MSFTWLPPPGSLTGLLAYKAEPAQPREFVPTAPYNGYGTAPYQSGYTWTETKFLTFTNDGAVVVDSSGNPVTNNGEVVRQAYASKESYIRNLSIYQGGYVYGGLTFGGEAKETFFRDGKFVVLIADSQGRPIAASTAYMTNAWSPLGWKRFQVKIEGTLPDKLQCMMIFQSGNAVSASDVTRVSMPVVCSFR
jgi:hypothetical protein